MTNPCGLPQLAAQHVSPILQHRKMCSTKRHVTYYVPLKWHLAVAQAEIEILREGKVSKVRVQLKGPHRLIPSHIRSALSPIP